MRALADFVYPEPCIGCERLTRGGLCRSCLDLLDAVGPGECLHCGKGHAVAVPDCRDCRGRGLSFNRARQSVEFRMTARKAVVLLKYRAQFALADAMAERMVAKAVELEPRAITWVPTSNARLVDRGFDHARLLAEALADKLAIPAAEMLIRARETLPQVGLEPQVRRRNVVGAFGSRLLPPEHVLVVDDVFTTGASASESARALKAAGASQVDCLAFARAVGGRS